MCVLCIPVQLISAGCGFGGQAAAGSGEESPGVSYGRNPVLANVKFML